MANVLEGLWQVETYYGDVVELVWPDAGITRMVGFGPPDATHAVQRTPTQHGSTELGFRLEDRELLIGFAWSCSGTMAQKRRDSIYKILNYLASPLTFRRVMPDHTQLDLRQVFYAGGVRLDSAQEFDEHEYASARFEARDPVWYDPDSHSLTLEYDDFIHALYGDFATIDSGDGLTTDGDWYAFPTIAITGPCEDFDLRSQTSGQRIRYYGDVGAGEVVTIVCNPHPAYLSATSDVQGDVQRWIYPSDDFGGFALWPDPMAGAGANVWDLDTVGMTAASSVTFTWEDRYQGA